jgi:hypothetical protein
MSELTFAQITAAQAYDQDAVTAVLAEMDSRIHSLASKSAGILATNPARFADYAEEFRQDAMVALLEYLPRWAGDSVDAFREYLYGAMAGELKAKVSGERHSGVDRNAFSTFKAMVAEADGDVYLAEKLAQTLPEKGKRLSADRANAARLAWQGPVSIDKTSDDEDETSILHTLAVTDESNDEIRPKVGQGAALEALAVLQRYSSARSVLSALPRSAEDVDAIEDTVTITRDSAKYVTEAVAILRSYVSTVADGELAEDLREVADERREERAARIGMVHTSLDGMRSKVQAEAVRMSFGIADRKCFGTGDSGDLEGLAEALEVSPVQARDARSRGLKSFAKGFIKLFATSDEHAAELAGEAAKNLSPRGRK